MKINEFIEYVGNDKNKMLKNEQLQQLIIKYLEVKKYLSIKKKKELVQEIVDESILYEDGVFKFDDIEKYICFTMKTIAAYTNLDLSDDIEADYDLLCSAKLLDLVVGSFKKEYDDVNVLLQMKCDYILSGNNIEAQIGKFLTNVSDKLDNLTDVLSDKVKSFDISKLPFNKKDIMKIIDFIDTQK